MSNLPDQLLISDGRDELIAHLFGLKDWMNYIGRFTPDTMDNMYHRSCAISDEFYGTYQPLPLGWTPDLSRLIVEGWYPKDVKKFERIYECCMEHHSMRTVQLESLLYLTNALIFSWKTLIAHHLSQLYRTSNVDTNYTPDHRTQHSWTPPPPDQTSVETASSRVSHRIWGRNVTVEIKQPLFKQVVLLRKLLQAQPTALHQQQSPSLLQVRIRMLGLSHHDPKF